MVEQKQVVVLTAQELGSGDEILGKKLMESFIFTLRQANQVPETIILYNEGAKLSVADTKTAEDLKFLEEEGVKILVCGTCADYYGIKDNMGAGEISNMATIVETMQNATKLIRP